jgi:hypothetical protein
MPARRVTPDRRGAPRWWIPSAVALGGAAVLSAAGVGRVGAQHQQHRALVRRVTGLSDCPPADLDAGEAAALGPHGLGSAPASCDP